jgi:hypothetical protein
MKVGTRTISTVPSDAKQEFPIAQLEDEQIFMGGRVYI